MNLFTWNNPCLLIHLSSHTSLWPYHFFCRIIKSPPFGSCWHHYMAEMILQMAPPVFVFPQGWTESQLTLPFAILIVELVLSIIAEKLSDRPTHGSWWWLGYKGYSLPILGLLMCRHCLKETRAKNTPWLDFEDLKRALLVTADLAYLDSLWKLSSSLL